MHVTIFSVIGTVLQDRWRVEALLGRGGMGEVYLVEHLALGRREALKVLSPQLAMDRQFVSRFRREGRAVNRLRHPNIVALYDFGKLDDGRFFLAMEYAEGVCVRDLLQKDEVLPVPSALRVLGQLAYAVHHAHARGVIHRDLKPANLILKGDALKVLDFGMAKIVAADVGDSAPVSAGNVVWGTPAYMAPERLMGVGDDPRSDLYAIGCIAFEILLGAPQFSGTPDEVVTAQLGNSPEAPSQWRPSLKIPAELDQIVLRCLAKRPDDRFQSAAELYAALRKVPGYPAEAAPSRRHYVPIEASPEQLDPTPPGPGPDGNLRGALRQLAEALLDRGVVDARLVSRVAYLRDHEQALARLEAAQDALEHEAEAVRQTALDREAALRFARGELQLLADATLPHLAATIKELDERLAAAAADADRLRALEDSIASVADLHRAQLLQLKTAYAALESTVEELLPPFAGDPELEPIVRRLSRARRRRPPSQR